MPGSKGQAQEASEIPLERAIEIAMAYLGKVAGYMKAEVYGLEETEFVEKKGRPVWGIAISLLRQDGPRRKVPVTGGLRAEMMGYPMTVANPNVIVRRIEIDAGTGQVLRMVDAG